MSILYEEQKAGNDEDTRSTCKTLKGMEHVPNMFMSFDKYFFLEMINILI